MQKPAATADHTWSMAINETHMHMVACMRASIIRKTLTHAHTHTHTHKSTQTCRIMNSGKHMRRTHEKKSVASRHPRLPPHSRCILELCENLRTFCTHTYSTYISTCVHACTYRRTYVPATILFTRGYHEIWPAWLKSGRGGSTTRTHTCNSFCSGCLVTY